MTRAARPTLWIPSLLVALACDGGLRPVPEPTGIAGTVTFRGPVPDSTAAVYVIAYSQFPQSRNELFGFQPPLPLLQSLPLDAPTAAYQIEVPSGRYEWVLAAWVKQGFTLGNADSTLREAGYYRHPSDTSRFGAGVVLVGRGLTRDIDFEIDFGNMHPVSFYFPVPPP